MLTAIVLVRSGASLVLAVIGGRLLLDRLTPSDRPISTRGLALGALLAALCIAQQLSLAAYDAAPEAGFLARDPLWTLAIHTWSGRMLFIRMLFALGTAVVFTGSARLTLGFALVSANLFLIPFSGHAATAEPEKLSLILHGAHVTAALIWIGGVASLAWTAFGGKAARESLRQQLMAFSPAALLLVAVAVATGVAAAYLQIGPFAALIGTAYGQLLLLKAGVFLGIALAAAAWLRWRFLTKASLHSPLPALAVEIASGFGVLIVATLMAQNIPGRHADVVWPLSFRLDWRLLFPTGKFDGPLVTDFIVAAGLLACGLVCIVWRQRLVGMLCALAAVAMGWIGAAGLAVEAYPTTYAMPMSSYSADSLGNAMGVYRTNCAMCHGDSGRGDGPLLDKIGGSAADLTAPHTADHTPGDMFWWIGYGRPPSIMPGAAEATSVQDRWDLVNFVRLLTNSARSMEVTGEIDPLKPFLPSIDFSFVDASGGYRTLRDQETAGNVLLVLGREAGSVDRLAEIEAALPEAADANLLVVFACGSEIAGLIPEQPAGEHLILLHDQTAELIDSWTYYRRTFDNPDPGNRDPYVGHLEFLIDRFGYVRAKWRTDEGLFPAFLQVVEMAKRLNTEAQILPSPEEHLH